MNIEGMISRFSTGLAEYAGTELFDSRIRARHLRERRIMFYDISNSIEEVKTRLTSRETILVGSNDPETDGQSCMA